MRAGELRVGDRVRVTNERSRFFGVLGDVSLISDVTGTERILVEFDASYGFSGRDGRDWHYPFELALDPVR